MILIEQPSLMHVLVPDPCYNIYIQPIYHQKKHYFVAEIVDSIFHISYYFLNYL